MEIHLEMLRVALHTICTMMLKKKQKKTAATKNKIRSGWIRLFVRAEVDGVKEPGSQPARQASRPVPCSHSECSPVDVEAYQCRAKAVSISLWCYSPLIAP